MLQLSIYYYTYLSYSFPSLRGQGTSFIKISNQQLFKDKFWSENLAWASGKGELNNNKTLETNTLQKEFQSQRNQTTRPDKTFVDTYTNRQTKQNFRRSGRPAYSLVHIISSEPSGQSK